MVTAACNRIPYVAEYFGVHSPKQWEATKKLIEKGKQENPKRGGDTVMEAKWKKLKNGRISFKQLASYVTTGSPPKSKKKYIPKEPGLKFLSW